MPRLKKKLNMLLAVCIEIDITSRNMALNNLVVDGLYIDIIASYMYAFDHQRTACLL
jgi:hypothetical protein